MTGINKAWQVAMVASLAIGMPVCGMAEGDAISGRSISVTGTGEAFGAPDRAQISAGVQSFATTVAAASRDNQASVERIMGALDDQGIDAEDIQTANYSIWPEQDHDPRQAGQITITGYRVSNMVNVTIDDIDKVGEVLAAVTNAGANSINGVNFSVEDSSALEQSAQKAAMEDARARAEALAELAGVELGDVLTISTSPSPGYFGAMMARGAADAAVPGISRGQLSVSVQVNLTFAIR